MSLISAVVFCWCIFVSTVQGTWIKDIISPEGFDIGNGLTAKLCDNKNLNATFFERVSLSLDYGDVGVSLAKKPKLEDLDINFHVNEIFEGRGKKKDMSLWFLIGFKAASMITAILGSTKLLVLKALMIAKIALMASAAILFKKLAQQEHMPHAIEIEHHGSEHYPVYADYTNGAVDAFPSASSQYYAYNNFVPSAAGQEQIINYSTVNAPQENGTILVPQQSIKRKDGKKKLKVAPTLLTIKRYTLQT